MLGKHSGYRIAFALLAFICLSVAVSGASQAEPVKGLYLGTFNVLQAWEDFGILSAEEPNTKVSSKMPILQILDAEGKLVSLAQWDGTEPKVSADGKEWAIVLSATIGFKRFAFELRSSWTDKTKLNAGLIKLMVTTLGEPADVAKYFFVLRFPGSGSWVSKDGKSAVAASIEGFKDSLAAYIALAPVDDSCTFKSKQMSKNDSSKVGKKLFYIEASSSNFKGEVQEPLIMGVYITKVIAWSYEPVLALSAAINSDKVEPDVRIFGTVDKQTASPGESLNYTYFLFNAGMDEATDLSVSIPVQEKTGLITSSISGDPGIARLMPSGKEIEVEQKGQNTGESDMSIKSIQWSPERDLRPGETISISFSISL